VSATAEAATRGARRRAAEVARRFTGWTVWMTAQGSPVATRSGGQLPPEPYDGNWAQTVMADDWGELESELAAQAKFDAERLSNWAACPPPPVTPRQEAEPGPAPGPRRSGGGDLDSHIRAASCGLSYRRMIPVDYARAVNGVVTWQNASRRQRHLQRPGGTEISRTW
jgi:hypothetical protein